MPKSLPAWGEVLGNVRTALIHTSPHVNAVKGCAQQHKSRAANLVRRHFSGPNGAEKQRVQYTGLSSPLRFPKPTSGTLGAPHQQ
jgi:hypothetical protein